MAPPLRVTRSVQSVGAPAATRTVTVSPSGLSSVPPHAAPARLHAAASPAGAVSVTGYAPGSSVDRSAPVATAAEPSPAGAACSRRGGSAPPPDATDRLNAPPGASPNSRSVSPAGDAGGV